MSIEKRKVLETSVLYKPTAESFGMNVKFDLKDKIELTPVQKKYVDKVTIDIMTYAVSRAKKVTTEEWMRIGKVIAMAVTAGIKKDHTLLLLYLQELGSFLMKHFLPDFIYVNELFTISKVGDKVNFDIREI